MRKRALKRVILSVMGFTIAVGLLGSCNEDEVFQELEKPEQIIEQIPSIQVVNQTNDSGWYITSVRLVGYEFNNLHINKSESQTFLLDKGMPGGYSDLNVSVSFKTSSRPGGSRSIKVNFNNGEPTTILFKGCLSYEGCNGFFLESNQ